MYWPVVSSASLLHCWLCHAHQKCHKAVIVFFLSTEATNGLVIQTHTCTLVYHILLYSLACNQIRTIPEKASQLKVMTLTNMLNVSLLVILTMLFWPCLFVLSLNLSPFPRLEGLMVLPDSLSKPHNRMTPFAVIWNVDTGCAFKRSCNTRVVQSKAGRIRCSHCLLLHV